MDAEFAVHFVYLNRHATLRYAASFIAEASLGVIHSTLEARRASSWARSIENADAWFDHAVTEARARAVPDVLLHEEINQEFANYLKQRVAGL